MHMRNVFPFLGRRQNPLIAAILAIARGVRKGAVARWGKGKYWS